MVYWWCVLVVCRMLMWEGTLCGMLFGDLEVEKFLVDDVEL